MGAPIIALTVILLLPAPARADQADPAGDPVPLVLQSGPLHVRDQFLLSTGFLAFDAKRAGILPAGRWQVEVVQNGTNTWLLSKSVKTALEDIAEGEELGLQELRQIDSNQSGKGIYFADGELYITSFGLHRGIGDRVQLSLNVPVVSFQGGFGDSIIQAFHDKFGYPQTGRLDAPEDQFTVYIRDGDGRDVYLFEDPGSGLGDIVAGVKLAIPMPSRWLKMAVATSIKVPTGDEESLYSSGSADYEIQIITSRCGGRLCLHVSGAAIWLGDSTTFRLPQQILFSGLVAGDWALGRRSSVIAQVTASQSPFEKLDVERLDAIAYLVNIGYKRQLRDDMVAFFAITENFVNFGSSLDVGLHVGWNWTF